MKTTWQQDAIKLIQEKHFAIIFPTESNEVSIVLWAISALALIGTIIYVLVN